MPDFVLYPHPALSKAARQRPVDATMLEAGQRLLAAVRTVSAYGLAAAHIGLDEPVVVISVAENPAERDYLVMFNPRIDRVAEGTASGIEGSVSMPGIEVQVVRPVWAELTYDSAEGTAKNLRLNDFPARVALHEIDQMNGKFFLGHISRLKREAAIRKFRKNNG